LDGEAAVLDEIRLRIGVRSLREFELLVEECADVADNSRASRRIVASGRSGKSLADGVGAIESVVQASQRALAAFSAYRALSTGTTSCGPAMCAISASTLAVSI